MSRIGRSKLTYALVLAVLVMGISAAPCLAAPQLEVSLTNNPTTLPRSDERMAYTATVTNTATDSFQVGDTLTCLGTPADGVSWVGNPAPSFAYRWLRGGTEIPGETARTYTTTSEDGGKVLQCLVEGTNVGTTESLSTVSPSLPPIVVEPLPATAPPSGTGRSVIRTPGALMPEIGKEIECETPTDWTGSPTWSYQWLRDGQPIGGATGKNYLVQVADDHRLLQCKAAGINPGGTATVVSLMRSVGSLPAGITAVPVPFPNNPTIPSSSATSGPVTLELELPAGDDTYVNQAKGEGWSCAAQPAAGEAHAKAICSRSDSLSPGGSYPPLTIVARLGEDAPMIGTATAAASGGGAGSPASAQATYTFTPGLSFGILEDSFEAGVFDQAGNDYTKAGGHPFKAYTTFGFNVKKQPGGGIVPIGSIKDVVVDAPRGFQGNALATPELCPSIEDVIQGTCPPKSVVGGVDVYTNGGNASKDHNIYPDFLSAQFKDLAIYSVEPEYGQPAQFAFFVDVGEGIPITFVPELRPDEGYAISFRTSPIVTQPPLWGSNVSLCDFGAKLTGTGKDTRFTSCRKPTEASAYPHPLITNPTRCAGAPPASALRINSWQNPGVVKTYGFTAPPITECDQVSFEPEAELVPSSREADSPTGLSVEIAMPTDGLLSPTGVGQANLDTAKVTFPKGMTVNPAAAAGLQGCTPAQVQLKTNAAAACPASSKVGMIEIDTPIIRETLRGSIYLAAQNDNPFKAAIGLYMVFSSERDGVTIKIAGKLVPDPVTGQLVSTFTENPEAPFSRLALKFTSGPRAPLINPPKCGTYAIHAEFSPWSAVNPANPTADEIVSTDSLYQVNRGPGGRACPKGKLEPKLSAGVEDRQAGSKSTFALSLSREDGTQHFTGLEVKNPLGLTAYLKGIPYCPDSTLATISSAEETGRVEIAQPACPAASRVGVATASSGAGPNPFYVDTGRVYLAGPYQGAPLSLAIVTPAVAGPFDLGNVLVRTPLFIDPVTAQVTARAEGIPTSLHGLALDLREVRVSLNRPGFTAAPTSCEPKSVDVLVSGDGGSTATVSNRFQVGGCDNLSFKPKLSLRLFGGTRRSAHPRLVAKLKMPPGGANVASASVALPHSQFLDQAHIRTICTRVQFAAKTCPAAAIYGQAEATSPLLDHALAGPVYLRSSSNPLPDLVAVLRGPDTQPIEVELAARIDSVNGGIRSSFDVAPDAPVSSFTLRMQGGSKGLLVNSRDLCKSASRATALFTAQNGKTASLRPVLANSCQKHSKGRHR